MRDSLLPAMDTFRGIAGSLGMRLFSVAVVSRTWTGTRSGLGTNTDTRTSVRVDIGLFQCKVTQVTEKDAIASGGLYSNQDLKVGPITPPFCGSDPDGNDITVFDPVVGTDPKEIFFNIKGPGFPAAGAWFKKVAQDVTKPLHYEFTVQRTAEIP